MKVNNYPVKTPAAGDRLFGSDSNGDQKQFDMTAVSSNVFQYEIGEYVEDEGGVIAHRWLSTTAGGSPSAGSFQNYLVVDINDLSSGAPFTIGTPPYSPTYYNKWDGNTNCINFTTLGGAVSGTAIYLCNISTSNGKNDWYLPAIDELSKIWHNRWEIGQGLANAGGTQLVAINSNSADYLSSTSQGENVYLLKPFFGYVYENDTANSYYVRAVRKFSI